MGCGSSKSVKAKAHPPRPRGGGSPSRGGGGGGGGGSDNSSEESDADRIYAFKDTLRKRALPMIEARTSCENLDALLFASLPVSDEENFAALRIQKQLRRKQAKTHAERDQKWMLFSNLDAFDEAEMVKLAQFMEAAMEKVAEQQMQKRGDDDSLPPPPPDQAVDSSSPPSSLSSKSVSAKLQQQRIQAKLAEDDDIRTGPASSSSSSSSSSSAPASPPSPAAAGVASPIMAERSLSHEKLKLLDMGQITVASGYNRGRGFGDSGSQSSQLHLQEEYDLPAGQPISPGIAKNIIDVYKNGGKLSTKAVTKLLRLSYRKLQSLPNTTHITVGPEDKLIVVGDIHGQLPDLIHILDEAGLPSVTNKYIFNGDFVDRGPCGVEVMCILMALLLAFPQSVALNRGNHEDFAICCVYGFQKECCDKYDYDTFGMFSELFQHLPLFCLVNQCVFVLHGGLFHASDVTLAELDTIKRTDFTLKDLPADGEPLESVSRDNKEEFLKQVLRDALWSDPMAAKGFQHSSRGAGVNFGPDIAKQFLQLNNLKMVVRSHEVCRTGFELPFAGAVAEGDDEQMVATIFSASNYSGGGNSAAYMIFSLTSGTFSKSSISHTNTVKVPGCDLQYRVCYFHIDPLDTEFSALPSAESTYVLSLHDLILRKRDFLLEAFELADPGSTGLVTKAVWAEVMQRVLQLQIRWMTMIPDLVPDSCLRADEKGELGLISYGPFIEDFSVGLADAGAGEDAQSAAAAAVKAKKSGAAVTSSVVDSLYAHHKELFAVFSFFDKDGDGRISRDEFAAGCEALSKLDGGATSAGAVFKDSASLLEIMDLHGRGVVDINEFYEMFRVSETLASKSNQQLQQQLQQQQQAQAPVLQRRRASFQLPKRSDSVQDGVTSVSIEGVARSITSDPELLKLSTSPTSPTSPYSPVGGGGIAAAAAAAVAAAEAASPVPVDI